MCEQRVLCDANNATNSCVRVFVIVFQNKRYIHKETMREFNDFHAFAQLVCDIVLKQNQHSHTHADLCL